MTCINLIPIARQDAKQRRARTKVWFTVGAAYGSLVVLVVAFTRVAWVFDSRTVTNQLAGLKSEIEKSDEAAKNLRVELKHARDLWETRNVVAEQCDWSILLAVVSQSLTETDNMGPPPPGDVVLRSFQLKQLVEAPPPPTAPTPGAAPSSTTPAKTDDKAATSSATPPANSDRFVLSIAGLGRTQSAVTQFVLRLEQLKLFDQVRLLETRREPFLTSDAIAFRIQAAIGNSSEKPGVASVTTQP